MADFELTGLKNKLLVEMDSDGVEVDDKTLEYLIQKFYEHTLSATVMVLHDNETGKLTPEYKKFKQMISCLFWEFNLMNTKLESDLIDAHCDYKEWRNCRTPERQFARAVEERCEKLLSKFA